MKTKNFQNKMDEIIDKSILWLIPETAKPNHFSYFRIFCVPFIYILLEHESYHWAFALFIIAASTDFIDGALARTRNQITDLGKILDPLADKMLILTALIFIGFEYIVVKIFLVVILFEVIGNLAQALFAKYLGRPIPANVFGKVKMVLQSICVTTFLIGLVINNQLLLDISEKLLFVALFFALIASFEQMRIAIMRQFTRIKETVK